MAERDEMGPIVSAAWLQQRLGAPGIRVIDARPFDRYTAAHIPGAVNAELHTLQIDDSSPAGVADFIARAGAELRRIGVRSGERVIFYEEFSGTLAARGVWLLDYLGHGGGAILDGGLNAWYGAGGALTRELTRPVPSNLTIAPDPSLLATADELRAAVASDPPEILPLDTRNELEYRRGTIPGSVHLEWVRHLAPDGSFRPLEELRALYAAAGIDPEGATPIATFCASGFRAAHSYVVLRAIGYPRVKNYAASWDEWGNRPDLAVELPVGG